MRLDPLHVLREPRPADLHLDRAKAPLEVVVGLTSSCVQRQLEVDPAGIARHSRVVAAEQPPQRRAEAARLQVPQRDVDGREGQHRRAAAAAIVGAPTTGAATGARSVRVGADQELGHVALERGVDRGAVAPDRVGVADAFRPVGVAERTVTSSKSLISPCMLSVSTTGSGMR